MQKLAQNVELIECVFVLDLVLMEVLDQNSVIFLSQKV
jgi:hypothetical protein